MSLREHIEFDPETPPSNKEYTGPQNAQELMKTLDTDYNKSLAKTRVTVSGKFTAKTTSAGKITGAKTTTYSSDLTISEIDARYPRAEWLQLLLDKGITIDDSLEYASLLSKRYTLALLEDNPDLQQSGLLNIPPTDDWETYKAAYIDKLVNDHTKIQASAEQIERGKQAVERAKAQIEQSRKHVKLAIERSKEAIERAKAQLERSIEQLERAQKELNSQQLVHVKKQIESVQGNRLRAQEALEAPKNRCILRNHFLLTSQIRIKLKGVQYVNDYDSKRDYASYSERSVRYAPFDVSIACSVDPLYQSSKLS